MHLEIVPRQSVQSPLHKYAADVASQFGEDGLIAHIIDVIKPEHEYCVEFGAWDGERHSNCYNLVVNRTWRGLMIEADAQKFAELQRKYRGSERVITLNRFVSFEGADALDNILAECRLPQRPGLISIDIDGCDFYVWESLRNYQPEIVVIEMNPTVPNDVVFVQEKSFKVNQGCSLRALVNLGKMKGYELAVCTTTNALFVRSDKFPLLNIGNNEIDNLYLPEQNGRIFHGYDRSIHVVGFNKLMWGPKRAVSSSDFQLPPTGGNSTPAKISAERVGKMKLCIGGRARVDGWTVCDVKQGPGVDYVCEYDDLSAFPDASVTAIYACHILQRLGHQTDMLAALKEWYRVLTPGGELMISVPDLDILCWHLTRAGLDVKSRFFVMRLMFGGQADVDDFSVSGITQDFLGGFLEAVGFVNAQRVEEFADFNDENKLRVRDVPISLNARAWKPPVRSVAETHSFVPRLPRWPDIFSADDFMERISKLGIICKTFVDVGSADGNFSLTHYETLGMPVVVNVDANPVYESSLKAIAETLDGHYVIAAVMSEGGEVDVTEGAHSYWDSVRPPADPYWKTVNHLTAGTRRVASVTLDDLAARLALPPPYFLKLDLQGAEELALKGGERFLRDTDVVLIETHLHDYSKLHRLLEDADFALIDFAEILRVEGGRLGWFYPVYVKRGHPALTVRGHWSPELNAASIQTQERRRQSILQANEKMLEKYRRKKTQID